MRYFVSLLIASLPAIIGQLQKCSPGWALPVDLTASTSRCYKIIDAGSNTMTWVQAQAQCRALLPAFKSSLAAIRNAGQVRDVTYAHCGGLGVAGEPIWIGLYWPPGFAAKGSFEATYGRGVADRSTWRWENGADHTYITTSPGADMAWMGRDSYGLQEPDDFGCGALNGGDEYQSDRIGDLACDTVQTGSYPASRYPQFYYIRYACCESELLPTITGTVTPSHSFTPSWTPSNSRTPTQTSTQTRTRSVTSTATNTITASATISSTVTAVCVGLCFAARAKCIHETRAPPSAPSLARALDLAFCNRARAECDGDVDAHRARDSHEQHHCERHADCDAQRQQQRICVSLAEWHGLAVALVVALAVGVVERESVRDVDALRHAIRDADDLHLAVGVRLADDELERQRAPARRRAARRRRHAAGR